MYHVNYLNFNKCFIELKNRFLTLLLYLLIFRIGSFIPIPIVNINVILNNLFKNIKDGSIINMFSMFSGGSIKRASIFSLGIIPYISSSIIIQILCITFDFFKELKKDNEKGKNKVNKYVHFLTIFLSIFQSIITIFSLPKIFYIENSVKFNLNIINIILSIFSLVTGTLFLVWLSNEITINGIGNGISMIIFFGILSEIPENFINIINQIINKNINLLVFILCLLIMFIMINFIIFIESGERKILINYFKKYNYRNFFYNNSYNYLPIKINISGVTPIIFASNIMILLFIVISFIEKIIKYNFFYKLKNSIFLYNLLYNMLYVYMIFLFCKIYSSFIFNSNEISENLKKTGAYISSIRPGNQTYIYIKDIVNKLNILGSCYISIIYLLPNFIKSLINYDLISSGTSLLIIVTVILDILIQIKTIMIYNKYYLILKKINIKNEY